MEKNLVFQLSTLNSFTYIHKLTLFLLFLFTFASLSTGFLFTSSTEAQVNSTTIIPYLDTGYKFKVVSFGEGEGFEQSSFDASDFSTGDAGFGTPVEGCSLNNPNDVKTAWPLNTDILLRKEFIIPSGTMNLKVGVAIDNDVQVFINGHDISGGLRFHDGCPNRDSFIFTAPNEVLIAGINLLAVRGRDRGSLSYIDVQVNVDIVEDCTNGEDDDDDGLVDCEDPDCYGQACVEVCDDGWDNDGDSYVDCADTDCPPCQEICGDGLDNDRDGLVDCDDPDCAGSPACCDNSIDYSKGLSSITLNQVQGNKDRASLKMCVNRTFCDALRAGVEEVVVRLDDCNQITIPGSRLKSNRTKTLFTAASSTYVLKIDCKKGTPTLTLRNLALKVCVSNPVKTCVFIKDGPCLCAEEQFTEKRDRKGNLVQLLLNVRNACVP